MLYATQRKRKGGGGGSAGEVGVGCVASCVSMELICASFDVLLGRDGMALAWSS